MRITFCLPNQNYRTPIGGFKIVYEYANRLVGLGHQVGIVYCTQNTLAKYKMPEQAKMICSDVIVKLSPKWFPLDRRVRRISAHEISDRYVPTSDVVFATAAKTALEVAKLSPTKGRKFYLIQGYENWTMSDLELINTYCLGFTNVVVSNWLYEVVKPYSDNTYCIKNPVDTNKFKVITPIAERNKFTFGFLYHDGEYKGTNYTIEVLRLVKVNYPRVRILAFGNPTRPSNLPEWVEYHRNASQEEVINLYNKCSIFVCSSIIEGFGLTGLESMACGCAFITSGYKGAFEYCEHNRNALVSPVRDVKAMYNNIDYLLQNDRERQRIAQNAVKDAINFSWDNAIQKMARLLET